MESDEYTLFENKRWADTNMVMSLYCAREFLIAEECIISYADIVYNKQIVKDLIDDDSSISIAYDLLWESLWKIRFSNPLDDAETFQVDENGIITEIGNKPKSIDEIRGQYMGLLKIKPAGWKVVEGLLSSLNQKECDSLDMTRMLQLLIKNKVELHSVPTSGKWCEVDSQSDLLAYCNKLKRDDWFHDWQ